MTASPAGPGELAVLPVTGLPEIAAGADLAALISRGGAGPARRRHPGRDVQDRQQGRGPGRDGDREALIDAEAVRTVARRGPTGSSPPGTGW